MSILTARPSSMAFFAVLLTALALSGSVAPARAQITPPAPGVELPPGYKELRARDRTAFQFRRAWFRETQRIQENRAHLQRIAEGLAPGLLPGSAALDVSVTGTRRVPVLAGKYSNTGADPYTPAQLQGRLFDGPNPTGTITQYYQEVSYGAITLTGTVHGTVAGGLIPAAHPDTYYEGNPGDNGLRGAARTGEYLKELLDATDATVSFAQYDNDGPDGIANSGDDDGYVDFVAFVQPETGGECGTNNIWSHRWVYEGWWGAPYTTNDAAAGGGFIKVSDYTIQPLKSCSGLGLIEIGVYTHEFGHAFGLPDLYDTDGSSNGLGQWCLMASGSYGGDGAHPDRPVHMSAWCKEQLGWVNPVVICENATGLSLAAAAGSPVAYKVFPHGAESTEYFLIENRAQTGFDGTLATSGLAVFHVDNMQSDNANDAHRLVDIEEADGLGDLDAKRNRGDAGDLFPGSTGALVFNDTSIPNSRDYAGASTWFSLGGFGLAADPRSFNVEVTPCHLTSADVVVNDQPCGNNNAHLDGHERADIRVGLGNDFLGPVTGVTGTLLSLTPGVIVHQGTSTFGTVLPGATQYGTPEFDIEATASLADGETVRFLLSLTGDGGYSSSDTLTLYAGSFVLLVEDDGAAVNRVYFQNALSAAGYARVLHDVTTKGLPPLGTLHAARAVVWYTGEAYDFTVSPREQDLLRAYLDSGGALFLSGQDIGYDLVQEGNAADRAFYANYLHADFVADNSGIQTLGGVAGDPVGDGLSLNLQGLGGANDSNWPSIISPRAGASNVLLYAPGNSGAVRYPGTHRVVYFAFCFESITSSTVRATLMERIIGWLTPGDRTPPTATLTSPVGGETLNACGSHTITWTASDNVAVTGVDLRYSLDGGATYPGVIATGLANTGSHPWSPGGLQGNALRVKVVAHDAAGLQAVAWSASNVSIAALNPPGVTVLLPNGGEAYACGDSIVFAWSVSPTCVGYDSSVVSVSAGGGAWTRVGAVPAPGWYFTWAAPDTAVDSLRVRVVVWAPGGPGTHVSDGLFSVADLFPPSVDLLAPNGGENLGTGNPASINWTASDDKGVASVDLYFSPIGAGAWTPIALGLTAAPPFAWTVPNIPTASGRVRVVARDAFGNTAADSSQSVFVIADDDPPSVMVSVPGGGETLFRGFNYSVNAAISDNVGVDSVCVSLSLDAGASWRLVVCGVLTFPRSWTVPDTSSDSCLIAVRAWDGAGNVAADTSAALFRITSGSATAVPPGLEGTTRLVLFQNHPNPLRGASSTFGFYLPREDRVELTIYDLSGRAVRVLAEGTVGPGYHERVWDGTDELGREVGHGMYFYVLQTSSERQVRKLAKLR